MEKNDPNITNRYKIYYVQSHANYSEITRTPLNVLKNKLNCAHIYFITVLVQKINLSH